MHYFFTKKDAARFVSKTLDHLDAGSQLTITIDREKSGDFYVTTAITELLEELPTPKSSKGLDVT